MKQRLIDANAAIQWVKENECYTDKFKRIMEGVIDKQPTVDAVPVVRCGKCKYCKIKHQWNAEPYSECELTRRCVEDDWFCADGERKNGEEKQND